MGNKQKNQPLMIQCRSTCHLQTKSPARSHGWGWGCTDMERQGPPALGAAGVSHLSPHPRGGGSTLMTLSQMRKWAPGGPGSPSGGTGLEPLACWSRVCLAPRQYCLGQCLHDSSLPRPITVPGNRLQPPDLLIR